jgi:lipoprotein-anchoring transpeptidase ErfK/SrfK
MRRHVENQVKNTERDGLGIIVLFAMWVLALMALSAAAHGEEKQEQQVSSTSAVEQGRDGAQHRLPAQHRLSATQQSQPKPSGRVNAQESEPQESGPDDTVTLTRFILISIPDRQLALVDDGQVVKIYPIAVGAAHSPSPKGDFTIIRRVSNPAWSHKGKVAAPGSNNPVGSRWMGLSLKGYGIHGTNAPRSIGKAASHGCFRMGKKDVEELFKLVRVGDTVVVRAERDELVAQVFGRSVDGEVQVAAATATTMEAEEE